MRIFGIVAAALSLGGLILSQTPSWASEDNWICIVRPGSGGDWWLPNDSGSIIFFGAFNEPGIVNDPSVRDSRDGTDVEPFPPLVRTAMFRPQWRLDYEIGVPPWAYTHDFRRPLQEDALRRREWDDAFLWSLPASEFQFDGDNPPPDTGVPLPDTLHLYVQTPSADQYRMPDSIGGSPVKYSIILTRVPAGYSGPLEFVLPKVPTTGIVNGKYLLVDIALPALPNVFIKNPLEVSGETYTQLGGYGYRFVAEIVPEPSSVLALASCVAGFAALTLRRSKQ